MPTSIVVLDLETEKSAADCKICGGEIPNTPGVQMHCPGHQPIGWGNLVELGLSIGGYYDYTSRRIHWFDRENLVETVSTLVTRQPIIVSFNGLGFDFALIQGILRQRVANDGDSCIKDPMPNNAGNAGSETEPSRILTDLCAQFQNLAVRGYDILAEIWKADPESKFVKGINSLDSICRANGMGGKLSDGAQAPRDWAAGRRADVLNYCSGNIYKTREIFAVITETKGVLQREDGSTVLLPYLGHNGIRIESRAV